VIRIDTLSDDVLLDIFDFFTRGTSTRGWQYLIHVCRRWRCLVFASPHRLDLRLLCKPTPHLMVTLDIWPALPLIVRGSLISTSTTDKIAAALGHNNRVCEVDLWVTDRRQLEKVLAAMQVPFPEMTELRLRSLDESPPIIPDSFLGGSAPPQLRIFQLDGIPFPGLPKLLLSAIHLVIRSLQGILHPGYISSEAMAIGPALVNKSRKTPAGIPNRLNRAPTRNFDVHFHRHALSCPFSLTSTYMGIREYLEDLLARIDNLYSTT